MEALPLGTANLRSSKKPFRNSKDAFDALWIAYADLHMRFLVKARIGVDRLPLYEYSLDRVDGGLVRGMTNLMQRPYDRTVQVAPQPVRVVFGERKFCRLVDFEKALVGGPHLLGPSGACQV